MLNIFYSKINKSIVKNSFYLYLGHFADYLLSLLILPLIARILGPKELGYVLFAQTFSLFLLLIMEFGFSLTATRKIAKIKKQKTVLIKYIGNIFLFKFFLIPLIVLLSFIVILVTPAFQLKPHYIWISMFGAIFQGLAPIWYFQGVEKFKEIALSKFFFRIMGFILIYILLDNDQDGWVVLMGHTVTSGFIFLYLIKKLIDIIGRIKLSLFKDFYIFWKESIWMFVITIIPVVFQNFAAFLLVVKISPIQLGIYFGVFKIYRSFNTLYGPIGQAIFPRLISYNEINEKKTKKLALNILWILFSIGIFFSLLLIIFPEIFIEVLLGSKFLGAKSTLQLFGIVLPLTAISHVLGRQWMLVQGQEKKYAIILFFCSVIAIFFIILKVSLFNINVVPISLIIFEISTIFMILVKK
jgi:polysaccharide transporter, PST family